MVVILVMFLEKRFWCRFFKFTTESFVINRSYDIYNFRVLNYQKHICTKRRKKIEIVIF